MKKLACLTLIVAALLVATGCDELDGVEFAIYGPPGYYDSGPVYYEDTYDEYSYEDTYYEETYYEDSWYDDWFFLPW